MHHTVVVGLGVLSLGLAGCFVTTGQGERIEADLRALKNQQADAQKRQAEQLAILEERIEAVEASAKSIQQSVDGIQQAQGQTVAGLDLKVEEVRTKVLELNGAIEVAQHRIGQLEAQASTTPAAAPPKGSEPPAPIVESKAETKAEAPSTAAESPGTDSKKADKVPPRPKDIKEILAWGKKYQKEGNVSEARWAFQEIGKRWPKEKNIADEAFFLLGESYFKEKQWRPALQEYIKVVEKFAAGAFADDAYYRIGECSIELGKLDDAEIFFNEILKSYKTSSYAKDAKKKLDELAKKKRGKK